ncbi:P-type ATPase subfamily IV protein [Dioscorea alata]|uniref:P-type ATPase subfamily IV protein n=1 Tax=Dioscorea alata TaxID=55571 RepID=A0ACB7V2D8_DIOAL|nr:P-type ATPase subfamily IV protein [Dioscorea alata]
MHIGSSRTPLIHKPESEPISMPSSSSSADPPPDNSRLIFISDPDLTHRESDPSPNSIHTTKYSLLTFIPRNLFEQFRRVAYIYFLLLALLNQIPQLTVFGRETAFVPLGVVLFATAVKDAYEDYCRYRSDKAENHRTAFVFSLSSLSFVSVPWKHVRAGDIVRVVADEAIPCDLVLLSTSDHSSGAAYVQTLNLDGESNLKTRYALQETLDRGAESWVGDGRALAVIRCEMPNLNIYGFQATIEIDGRRIPLGPNNVVLRGCEIKNTRWIIGVAVYTGMETKVMLNNSGAPSKRSRLETRMNREILMLAGTMVALCTIIATCTGVWLHQNRDKLDTLPFYRKRDFSGRTEKNYLYSGIGLEILFAFLKSIFSFQNFIPISLYISMEIARVTQSYMMTKDKNMYHEATDTKFQCRALNINEDLGQIKYVFSDKTGTLTENKMVFQCASVDGVDYSCAEEPVVGQVAPHPTVVDGQVWRPKMVVNTDPQLMHLLETGKGTQEWMHVYDFFIVLAACNTVVPQVSETSEQTVKLIEYQGESPDEQALVYAAAAYGFVLIERSSGHIVIDVLGERQRFTLLGLHEFDSDRKRMSVIVGCGDQTIKLFVKGADNAMLNVIDKTLDLHQIRATETHLHKYSSLGLRTLVIGMRELSTAEFEEWQLAYNKAGALLTERAESLRAVALKIECSLHILGASGIEDKLQQGVPEAIESLRQAGIKVWVLTGDKQETAISIGYSCKLLTDDMTQIIINSDSKESCKSTLEDAISTCEKVIATSPGTENQDMKGHMESQRVPVALIIDGPTLVFILETELEEELYKLATACDVVLCCRVAPLQKAGIVSLMKKRTSDMSLSIGDGMQ